MAMILKSTRSLATSFPQAVNTTERDAISALPGLYDQWWVDSGLATGFGAASTSEWEGLKSGKRLIGRTGTNAVPLDYIEALSAANDKDVLRSGWDTDADPDAFDGNNERTVLISTENVFDGSSSFAVFWAGIMPATLPANTIIWGNDVDTTTTRLQVNSADGRARYYQDLSGGPDIDDSSDNYADETPFVFGIGWDATDEVIVWRVNGVQVATATSISAAPDAGKFVLGSHGSTLTAAFTGWHRSLVIYQGASLMRSKSITGYTGDEDDALQLIEQAMMEDIGLTYPT